MSPGAGPGPRRADALTWLCRALVTAGIAMIGFGVAGGAGKLGSPAYLAFAGKVTAAAVFVVLPVALGAGWLIGRIVPVVARPVVQGTAFATALIVGIALPAVLGRGRQADLPSALPRNYAAGLWIVLAVVWAVASVLLAVRIRRARAGA